MTGPFLLSISVFILSFFISLFCLVPCGKLSWLFAGFWAHVNTLHRLSFYRFGKDLRQKDCYHGLRNGHSLLTALLNLGTIYPTILSGLAVLVCFVNLSILLIFQGIADISVW